MSEEIKYLSLLPCAFCGGEAKAFLSFHGNSSFVKCMNRACEVYTPPIPMGKNVTAIWNTRTPPTLPPVCPEDLVEGEWYYCVKRDWQGFGKAANDSWCNKPTGTMAIWIGDTDWSPQCLDAIYGPLKFKIGGAK